MEDDGLGLDLAVLDVDLVAAQHDGDVLTDAHEVAVPVGHILVRDARRHVKHDHRALAYHSADNWVRTSCADLSQRRQRNQHIMH